MTDETAQRLQAVFGSEHSRGTPDRVRLTGWTATDWQALSRYMSVRRVVPGETHIGRNELDRTLYFVLEGRFEVVVRSREGLSMSPLVQIGEGTVLGEQSFFDGEPRSASAWAIHDSRVGALTFESFEKFEAERPDLGRDLLFALARTLAARLRLTTVRIAF